MNEVSCVVCDGTGVLNGGDCSECQGTGWVPDAGDEDEP